MNNKYKIAIILFSLFCILTLLVIFNNISRFDTFWYNLITIKMTNFLTAFYKVITFLGSTKFIVGLCIFFLVLFILLKKAKYGLLITSCLIISTLFNNLVKIIIRRPRPEVLRLVTEKSTSYPSGHTMAAMTMYGLLFYLVSKSNISKKYKIIIYVFLSFLIIMVGISRIYLGAHFASDVIGGYLLALTLLLIEISIIESKKML